VKTPAGQKVETVKPGAYTIEVRDQSADHNFHLVGKGVNKSSAIGFVGTQRWSVTLAPGKYQYECDPHATVMKGALTVTENAVRKTQVSRFQVRRSGRQAIVSVRVNQSVQAKIELVRGSKMVSRVSARLRSGMNVKRLRAKRPGRHVVRLVLTENGAKRTLTRTVRF
jgi:hypothetical protein